MNLLGKESESKNTIKDSNENSIFSATEYCNNYFSITFTAVLDF